MTTQVGDKIQLKKQEVEVVKCESCDALMVNVDAPQLEVGDLTTIKKAGVRVSNPETDSPVCIKCEEHGFMDRLGDFFAGVGAGIVAGSDDDDDDDDSSFFGGGFGGGGSSSGGFSGFGGGGFSGGGASRGF